MNPLKLVIFDLDDTLLDTSGQLDALHTGSEQIVLFPGVSDLLKDIRAKGIFSAIVSTGDQFLQKKKMLILGLEALVDAIYLCDLPSEKLDRFKKCLHRFSVLPRETLVVGDRIDREICLGKKLGCVTVRVLQGRHSNMAPEEDAHVADYTMRNIVSLHRWLKGNS
jgi:FMN phosphatase YigB (HAD superfamily)